MKKRSAKDKEIAKGKSAGQTIGIMRGSLWLLSQLSPHATDQQQATKLGDMLLMFLLPKSRLDEGSDHIHCTKKKKKKLASDFFLSSYVNFFSDARKDVLDTLSHLLPVILADTNQVNSKNSSATASPRYGLRIRYLNAIAKQFATMQKRDNREALVQCMKALQKFIPLLEPVVRREENKKQ